MDETRRKAMRSAHTKHGTACACGRTLFGNGAKAHLRTCEQHLEQVGWPLDGPMVQAILEEYRGRDGGAVVRHVEQRLGQVYLQRRRAGDKTEMRWVEFRDLVWQLAEETRG